MKSVSPSVNLSEQVAVVTGGGRGIGRGIARVLASVGAAVAVAGRTIDTLEETVSAIRTDGGTAMPVVLDVTNSASVAQMVEAVESTFGPVDLLVNNAGILGTLGPLWEADPDEWWDVLNVNLRGAFLCIRTLLPGMIDRRKGRIINIASPAAVVPVAVYSSHYCASKAALVRLSDVLALEVADYGIAVFAINPGLVHTDMITYIVESDEGKRWRPDVNQWFEKGTGFPAEVAGQLVASLASGQLDALSGRFLDIVPEAAELRDQIEQIITDDRYRLHWRR
jgi:NAD(P)-dependent dehydrogenase (short-subunit alcohol dehydrogenase family)